MELVRRGRLTAHNSGVVIRAMSKSRGGPAPSDSILKSFFKGNKNLDCVKTIQWGRNHERKAVETYSAMSGNIVIPTGIWLHESGCFGASPDGLVGEDTVLEVKCPYAS